MSTVSSDKTILRFLYNQDIDRKKKFRKGKYIFFTWRYKHKNSVAIEGYKTFSEYKGIAKEQENLPARRFIGYAQLDVATINELEQEVEEAFEEFEGHAHIVYDSSFEIVDEEPLPNKLDQILIKMQESALYLIDKNEEENEFDGETYIFDLETKKKIILPN